MDGETTRRETRGRAHARRAGVRVVNIVFRDGVAVFLDWATCRLAPIGSDLGYLLGMSNRVVLERPQLIDDCLDAYVETVMTSDRGETTRAEIELGYRHRVISHSFRRLVDRLPATAAPTEHHHTLISVFGARRRSRLEADLLRLCDEGDALVALAAEQDG